MYKHREQGNVGFRPTGYSHEWEYKESNFEVTECNSHLCKFLALENKAKRELLLDEVPHFYTPRASLKVSENRVDIGLSMSAALTLLSYTPFYGSREIRTLDTRIKW